MMTLCIGKKIKIDTEVVLGEVDVGREGNFLYKQQSCRFLPKFHPVTPCLYLTCVCYRFFPFDLFFLREIVRKPLVHGFRSCAAVVGAGNGLCSVRFCLRRCSCNLFWADIFATPYPGRNLRGDTYTLDACLKARRCSRT